MKIKSIGAIAAILAISAALTGCAGKKSSVADGVISGFDESGEVVFSHEYSFCGYDGDMGFYEYKTDDENSGEFTYFLLRTDTPASTCHIEFRYGEDVSALLNYTEGKYAYRMGSGIIKDCGDEVAEDDIKLFCTENLT